MESLRGLFVLVQEHFLLRLLSRYAQVNSLSFRQIILTKSSQKYTVGKIFTNGSSKNLESLTKSFLFKCFSIELVLKDKDPVFRATSSPKFLHRHCFRFLLEHLHAPGRNFGAVKEVYFRICAGI